ncbi:unnamed protein product [Lactuca saligna]|uniref:Uncharacterized protein n=1 Tax=Lactuca saligna TaxID=75948 RepID=A0AA36EGD3_LACSI|nr:unnamed protein product [Lactuca saligna]
MSSAVWELPNLKELDLGGNYFSCLSFGLMRIPRLKFLDVSSCTCLVKLSELPSSIAVLKANDCKSLKTFGDTYNCKWLWKVSLFGAHEVGLAAGSMLLDYVLKDFDEELGYGSDKELEQESNEELDPEYVTHVGYVSFSSLRHIISLNSTYNVITISVDQFDFNLIETTRNRIGAKLIPRKNIDDLVQTTKEETGNSEFWDEEVGLTSTITIEPDSSIKIVLLT